MFPVSIEALSPATKWRQLISSNSHSLHWSSSSGSTNCFVTTIRSSVTFGWGLTVRKLANNLVLQSFQKFFQVRHSARDIVQRRRLLRGGTFSRARVIFRHRGSTKESFREVCTCQYTPQKVHRQTTVPGLGAFCWTWLWKSRIRNRYLPVHAKRTESE